MRHNEFIERQKRAKVSPIRAEALRLAAERGAMGITNELIRAATQRDQAEVASMLARMVSEHQLVGVTVVGHHRHWFANEAAAQAWTAATQPKPKATPTPRQQMVVKRIGMPAPVTLGEHDRSGAPIITERTRITRDVRQWPTARWQMRQEAPDERWPRFAASRPGIDPDTGLAWADVRAAIGGQA